MESKERIKRLIAGESADRCGLWIGNPHDESWRHYFDYFGVTTQEAVRQKLGDDFRWFHPDRIAYKHPDGKPFFDKQRRHQGLSAEGYFADCEDLRVVEEFPWPNPDYLDFTETLEILRGFGNHYCASGMWCQFFHDVCDFFGMERYFIKMIENPQVVHAVTHRVVASYLQANERLFAAAGDLIDGFFFGNDLGSQLNILISPEMFDEFVLPYIRQFIRQGREHGYQIILHSCGSIHPLIPRLIGSGVDALHPLQAKARNMSAEILAAEFKGEITFIGGIDTQDLLVNATPEEVKADVRRVKTLLGPRLIVSPSHEKLLPNVPPRNLQAMCEAALEA